MAKDGFGKAIGDGKISLLRRKALTISLRQVGKGVGQASRLTFRPEKLPFFGLGSQKWLEKRVVEVDFWFLDGRE